MTLLGLFGLVSTALFRGGLLLRLFGMALVDAGGRPATFRRILLRGVLVWGAVIMLFPGGWLFASSRFFSVDALSGLSSALAQYGFLGMAPSAALIAAAAAWAVFHPSHGLQDRLAGTYLVTK